MHPVWRWPLVGQIKQQMLIKQSFWSTNLTAM